MKRTTALSLLLAAVLVALAIFVASQRCTCTLGNDWPTIEAARAADYSDPSDCLRHGAETE
jgi:hypothetical protein